jgi:hypothetical protein
LGRALEGSEAGLLEAGLSALNRTGAETSVRFGVLPPVVTLCPSGRRPEFPPGFLPDRRAVTGDGAHANSSRRASPRPELRPRPKLGSWCVLEAVGSTEVESSATRCPFWRGSTEVEHARQGTLGGFGLGPHLAEARWFTGRVPESRLPPACRRVGGEPTASEDAIGVATWVAHWCKTRSVGYGRHLPWGSVPFGVSCLGDRCAGLPPQHHPLSGFFTLSAVLSRPDRVALFHATSAHGVW